MFSIRQTLMTSAVTIVLAGSAGVVFVGEAAAATVLSDSNGMTLYTFDKDAGGVSACYGLCAVVWPPAIAPAGAAARKGYSLVPRSDGSMQWAYGGKPLYLYQNDRKPGDTTGDGVQQVWHVAIR